MTNLSETDYAISKLLDRTQELIELGKLDDAEKFLLEIAKYKPDDLNVPFQRGTIFMARGEYENALALFMIVREKLPGLFQNVNNIATAYYKNRQYNEAVMYYTRALEIKPDTAFVLAILAESLFRLGKLEEAMAYFRRALSISPDMFTTHSNLLLTMLYAESVTPEDLTAEAKKFGKSIAASVEPRTAFENKKDKERKIRIGYISPDFRDHPVSYFIEPLLKEHSHENFEIYVYCSTLFDNPFIDRMKKYVEVWRDVRNLKDEKICDIIREDAIDILVDVSGHTSYNHLKVFAQRAAPIQATWLGYPATTGLQTMDYRITDIHAEPQGMTEHLNSETLWRLPHIFCCYQAHEKSPDVIDHPPFEDNGYITFGCFNNFTKVRNPVLMTWAEILKRIPSSRLLLEIEGIDDPANRADIEARLVKQGMPLQQVVLESRKRSNQFVLYNKIDIALDPFPAVGGTTSMDTLWMGVPFVTLAGKHFASRMGVTVLTNAGLPELIAKNRDEYIEIAVDLATNREKLKDMRHNLRERFAKSPCMDQEAFARDMEDSYRGMWEKYCDSAAGF